MTITADTIRDFVPMNQLHEEALRQLAYKARVLYLNRGDRLFDIDSTDETLYYLLEGQIKMVDRQGRSNEIAADGKAGRHSIGGLRPRPARAVVDSPKAKLLRFNSQDVDTITNWSQQLNNAWCDPDGDSSSSILTSAVEVEELDENATEWMLGLLRSDSFHKVPPANIQKLAMQMEPMAVYKGDVIIRQDEPGDYYYVIRKGHCRVTRGDTVLAELGPMEPFGEEALASGQLRNATVTMISDGLLMRLSKAEFEQILIPPMVKHIDLNELKQQLLHGVILLDVRTRGEFKQQRLIRSINIPLDILRSKAHKLDKTQRYVVYCDTGTRSSAATFLLTQMGFSAMLLEQPHTAFKYLTAK